MSERSCYRLPVSRYGRRAVLQNEDVREKGVLIPVPYIESVEFDSTGATPLYLTVRAHRQAAYFLDVSNRSRIALADSMCNSMLLDGSGAYFSTENCSYDVSVAVGNMSQQLADLSGILCSTDNSLRRRMSNLHFTQTLYLHDQCGKPVTKSIDQYPELSVGNSPCHETAVDGKTGRWDFDCAFPGSDSSALRCQSMVSGGIVAFLFNDPFAGACPDLPSMIATLADDGQDLLDSDSLRAALYNQGLDSYQRGEADETVSHYEQLWNTLQQILSRRSQSSGSGNGSALEEYVTVYNRYRNFANDLCSDLSADQIPLRMNLLAGVTYIDAITTLDWAPRSASPYNVTIQDPSQIACCAHGSVAGNTTSGRGNSCEYPADAVISGSDCVCGIVANASALAYEVAECANYVGSCKSSDDCAGNDVCIVGSCCGGGICVDPYRCSQNGTTLVNWYEPS